MKNSLQNFNECSLLMKPQNMYLVDHPPTGADTNIDIYWNNICNIQTTLVINLVNYAILTVHQARIDSR